MSTNPRTLRNSGAAVLLFGLSVTVVLGVVAGLAGAVLEGSAAAWGAVVGALLIAVVCAGGSLMVNLVAGLMPSASLLVALLTYSLQVLVLVAAFVALERSGLVGGQLDRGWLGGTAVGTTFVWLVTQVVLAFRTRVPAYDLPLDGGSALPAPGGQRPVEGGER